VTLTSSEGVEPCGGTVEFLDGFASHVYEYWTATPIPDDFEIAVDLRRTSSNFWGGASGPSAWASHQQVLLHEMSHLIVGWNDGGSAPVFAEGMAEAIGTAEPGATWGFLYDHPESFAFLSRSEFSEDGARYYAPSAKLMRFLIHRYGVETVRAAYRAANSDDSAEEIEAVFVDVFGDGIYDAFDEFFEADQCGLQAWECSADVLPLREFPVHVERIDSCAREPGVIGFSPLEDGRWSPQQRFVVDLAEDSTIRVDITDNASVREQLCLSSCPDISEIVTHDYAHVEPPFGSAVREDTWKAGRHSIIVTSRDALPFSATIEVVE
jgi:hypothetical protein